MAEREDEMAPKDRDLILQALERVENRLESLQDLEVRFSRLEARSEGSVWRQLGPVVAGAVLPLAGVLIAWGSLNAHVEALANAVTANSATLERRQEVVSDVPVLRRDLEREVEQIKDTRFTAAEGAALERRIEALEGSR